MQNNDQMILHFFLCKVQTTQSNMFKYLKQKTIRMQMVSLITQKSLEQKHAPAECSSNMQMANLKDIQIKSMLVFVIKNIWNDNLIILVFVLNVSIEIQIAMKNLILWCNINSLCLRHHWSWQQHLNKICWFCSSFFPPNTFLLKSCKRFEYLHSNDFYKIMCKVDVCISCILHRWLV